MKKRCGWPRTPLSIAYHDNEWGVPVHDDRVHFEFLTLEGAQAGLSWETILNKRENYRKAFSGFDPKKVAKYDVKKKRALMNDPGIVRNRLKIESTITNAEAFLAVQKEFGSFDAYVWRFVGGRPQVNRRKELKDIPAKSPESDALSKDLLKRGFRFVGSTIVYAYMQACGLVDDHVEGCFRKNKTGSREFTNEVQHSLRGVLRWEPGSTGTSRSRSGVRLPGVAKPVSRFGRSRQLWIARRRALLGS